MKKCSKPSLNKKPAEKPGSFIKKLISIKVFGLPCGYCLHINNSIFFSSLVVNALHHKTHDLTFGNIIASSIDRKIDILDIAFHLVCNRKNIAIQIGDSFAKNIIVNIACLLYTSDAADERSSVDLGGRRI